MRPIRGVMFDVDGTLIDSNDAHARAWVEALEQGGHPVPFEKVRRAIGMGSDKLLPSVVGIEKESAEGKKLSAAWKQAFESRHLPHLRPLPGAAELVHRVKADGFRTGVASSSEKKMLKALLEVAGVPELLAESTSADDADRSKPDPDIVEAALKRMGLPAAEVVLIGDTPFDVEAGVRAGVRVLAFRSGGWDDPSLAGATAIYDNAADLLGRYDQSLLGAK